MEKLIRKNEIEAKASNGRTETKKRYRLLTAILFISFIALAVLSLFVYSYPVSLTDIFRGDELAILLMVHARIPRMMLAVVAGVGMSLCGLIMQAITKNRFVSPTTSGTLDGARLGTLLGLLLIPSASLLAKGLFAFTITLLTTFAFILIIERIKLKNRIFVPLTGIIFGGIISATTTFIGMRTEKMQSIGIALMGDFTLTLSGEWEIVLITIPFLAVAYFFANRFMIAGLGQDMAKGLGLNYRTTVNIGLVIVAVITSLVVITAGIIPFLGLIAPNLITLYLGDNLKKTMLPTILFGASFLLLCDIISRLVIWPLEAPVSLAVGVLGATLFLILLFVKRKVQE